MDYPQVQCDERFYARLRHRTAVGGVVIFLVPFLLFTLLLQFASERYVRQQLYERLRAGAAMNARLLDDVLHVRMGEVQWLARALEKDPLPSKPAANLLARFAEGHPWYGIIVVTDASGDVVRASQPLRGNVGPCQCLPRVVAGETLVTNVFFSPLTNHDEMFVATRLSNPGGHVLLVQLNRERLTSRFLDIGTGETEDTLLLNAAGEFVSPTRRRGHLGQTSAFAAGQPNPFEGERGTAEYRSFPGTEVLAAYERLRSKNYYLVTQVDRAEMQAPVRKLRFEVMLYVLPFLLLGVALAVFAWRYALNYIQQLMTELYQALQLARQREQERDVANQELARRFEQERELAQQKTQLQSVLAEYEKYAALAQLALGAAHEINNPLLGILSHLELELRASQDPKQREEIEQCIEGSKRIAATLRGLINYARPGPLMLSQVSLLQLVEDAVAFLAHQPMFRNITLENCLPPGLPSIHVDSNQLSQVLMNLLLNASQAIPQSGRITIAAKQLPGEKVEIRVEDTGTGIPADVLPHIFEPFFTTKRGKGTGLGLSISQAYVRNHGGEIEVDSIPGQGTTVRVTMPLHQEVREEQQQLEVIG